MKKEEENRREIRIFLSSTFRDLNDERTYLMDIVFPELTRICRERDLFLTVVDLRWGISNPDDEKIISHVMNVCFSEIERARPFFIGILAGRYGYVPKDDKNGINPEELERWKGDITKWKWFETGYSITHMEMEYGVLSKPDMANYSYFYYKSGKSFIEKDENKKYLRMLEELKKKIRSENSQWHWRRREFETPQELGEQIKEDFIEMLNSTYPGKKLSLVEKERFIHRQYSKFLLRNYLPMEDVIKNILQHIDKDGKIFVTGPVGIGKSSTLAYLKEKYEKQHEDTLIIEHYVGAGGNDNLLGIVSRIFNEIKEYLENRNIPLPGQEIPKSEDKLLESLPKWITTVPEWVNTLILIDGVDQIPEPTEMRFLAYLPERMKIVISSREGAEAAYYFSSFKLKNIRLDAISIDKRREIVKNILNDQGKELKEYQIDEIARSPQTGNPLYLRILMEELSKISELSKSEEDQDKFMDRQIGKHLNIKDIKSLYNTMIDRIEDVHRKYFTNSEDDLKNILTLIALSRSGLSENEIININGISSISFSVIRNEMDYHFSEKNGLIDFFHFSLKEAVINSFLSTTESKNSVRRRIADWFAEQASDERQIYELPYQLYTLKDKILLKKNLKKIEWFSLFTEEYGGMKYYEFMNYLRFVFDDFCEGVNSLYEKDILSSGDMRRNNSLGILYLDGACYKQSEPVFKNLLEMNRDKSEDFEVANIMSNLALLYSHQGRYSEAEPLIKEALDIGIISLGRIHPDVANTMSNLAALYSHQGRYSEAEPLIKEAREIYVIAYGKLNESVAKVLHLLGIVYYEKILYKESIKYLTEAQEIYKKLNEKSSLYGDEIKQIQDLIDKIRKGL